MGRNQHEEAHGRNGRPGDQSNDGGPHEEETQEVLGSARKEDHPRPRTAAAIACGGGVEETGEDAGIGADVLEDGDGVERGLVVALA